MNKPEKQFSFEIQRLIQDALPETPITESQKPPLESVYLPVTHIKALRPTSSLVVGIRGSGKSFWWSALQNAQCRKLYGKDIGITDQDMVTVGFGITPQPSEYPSRDVLITLLEHNNPTLIWKTILCKQLFVNNIHIFTENDAIKTFLINFIDCKSWDERISLLKLSTNLEIIDQVLYRIDQYLEEKKQYHLVLFDSLDRTAFRWHDMNLLLKGLLQNALDFQNYQRLRLKIFIRPDQIEDSETINFPDASKLLSQRTDLFWPREELYALLWHYFANYKKEENAFRSDTEKWFSITWKQMENIWLVPDELKQNEKLQRELFHYITGPQMGLDTRRGYPYTWLINHLGDTRKQVSPRSFLTAVLHASKQPKKSDYPYPIHYEAIKKGVQEASKIRVTEIEEDYPWVRELLKPLKKLSVPCLITEIEKIWDKEGILKKLEEKIVNKEKLPPQHLTEGAMGVLEDLKNLGLVEFLPQSRVNIPDVYRVGYGMKRRGGVKPAAKN